MSSGTVRETYGSTAAAGPFPLTIPATAGGSALIAIGVSFNNSTRVVTSNGSGTWTQLFDNGGFLCIWACTNPGTGTTQVSLNAGGTAGYDLRVMEVNGLKNGGLTYAASETSSGGSATWVTGPISPTVPVMSIAICHQGADVVPTGTVTGYAVTTDTGVSSGNSPDNVNFANQVAGRKDLAAGASQTAGGTWTSSVAWHAALVALELASASSSDQALLLLRP